MPCHNCGRTFLPDRLQIHLKSCDKAFSKKANSEPIGNGGNQSDSNFNTPDLRNRSMKADGNSNCSLCGRNFSKAVME
jgi:hypothetical protein